MAPRSYRKPAWNPARPGNARRTAGTGVALPSGERQIVCAFDEDSFAEIRELALASGISFRAQVRLLVEFGLEDVKQPTDQKKGAQICAAGS